MNAHTFRLTVYAAIVKLRFACVYRKQRLHTMSVYRSASHANRKPSWKGLSVCRTAVTCHKKLKYRPKQSNGTFELWTAAASMDASNLGDCYECMTVATKNAYKPRIRDISVCAPNNKPRRILTWDELSVCTDDETMAMPETSFTDSQVFSQEIVALASTVIKAAERAEYELTQSRVKHSALLSLIANLQGMAPELLTIVQYAKYKWTQNIDDALKALYTKLRTKSRFMRPVYGYPSRQIKVFYAAGTRERSVCKEIAAQGMDQKLFMQTCMPLRRPR